MTPTSLMLDDAQTLIGNDAGTLNPGSLGNKLHLIMGPFVPGPATDFTSLVEATFTGSSAKTQPISGTNVFFDPITQMRVIQINPPVGGWHWQASDGVNLPQTIYGWALVDNGGTHTWGSGLFDTPVLLQSAGDGVDIAEVRFSMPDNALQ